MAAVVVISDISGSLTPSYLLNVSNALGSSDGKQPRFDRHLGILVANFKESDWKSHSVAFHVMTDSHKGWVI